MQVKSFVLNVVQKLGQTSVQNVVRQIKRVQNFVQNAAQSFN